LLAVVGAILIKSPRTEVKYIRILRKPTHGNILRNLSDLSKYTPTILAYAFSILMLNQGFYWIGT